MESEQGQKLYRILVWRPTVTDSLHFGSFPAVYEVIDAEVVGQTLY